MRILLKNPSFESLRAGPEFIKGTNGGVVKSLVIFRSTELVEVSSAPARF